MRKTTDAPTPRRSLRRRDTYEEQQDGLPDAVREMLYEERVAKRAADEQESKSLKKRKTGHVQRSSSPDPQSEVVQLVVKSESATVSTLR